jgi:hypothetical protein
VGPNQTVAVGPNETVVLTSGDFALMRKFVEYARATKGMRAIVISRALTDTLGKVDDRTDEELAAEPETLDDWDTVGVVYVNEWRTLVRQHGVCGVLNAVQKSGRHWRGSLIRGSP